MLRVTTSRGFPDIDAALSHWSEYVAAMRNAPSSSRRSVAPPTPNTRRDGGNNSRSSAHGCDGKTQMKHLALVAFLCLTPLVGEPPSSSSNRKP